MKKAFKVAAISIAIIIIPGSITIPVMAVMGWKIISKVRRKKHVSVA